MGARIKVREIPSRWTQGDRSWITPQDYSLDIRRDGKGEFFEALKAFLVGESHSETYAELAGKFGVSEAALKMKVQRMRHRYQRLLREEIAPTVASPEEVEDEIRYLFGSSDISGGFFTGPDRDLTRRDETARRS